MWTDQEPAAGLRTGRRRGEDMDYSQDPAGPAALLVDGISRRNREAVLRALSDRVHLAVPPLQFSCTGRDEAIGAIEAILAAFPDLTYSIRSRYVAPSEVTDEVLLSGTHTGTLLGVTPTGKAGRVLARIQMRHDGHVLTSIAMWADGGALREIIAVPVTAAGVSSSVVSALRASMPDVEQRLIVGPGREPEDGARREVLASQPASAAKTAARTEVKAPIPRRTRRRRAALLATAMVVASGCLVAWVATGALNSTAATPRRGPTPSGSTVAAQTPPSASPSTQASATPLPTPTLDAKSNSFNLRSDVLFPSDRATLTPEALRILNEIIGYVHEHKYRTGIILVTGYTDSNGTAAHNKKLSKERAVAVADFLEAGLKGLPGLTVKPFGAGENDPLKSNDTKAGQAANRRVTVHLPLPAAG